MTFADACADCLLAADVQVSVKVRVNCAAGTYGSVIAALPFVAFTPGQLSPVPPPVAEQLLAFFELQVRVVGCPESIVVGDAVNVAVTRGHVTTTGAAACADCDPAVHVNP